MPCARKWSARFAAGLSANRICKTSDDLRGVREKILYSVRGRSGVLGAARAADLRALLARNVTQARQVVRLLLDGTQHGYAFAATGTYRKLGVPLVNVGGGPNGNW